MRTNVNRPGGSMTLVAVAGAVIAVFAVPTRGQVGKGPKFDKIVVFGDSLSDTGNVLHTTKAAWVAADRPIAPWYDNGRWTNGSPLNGAKELKLADTKHQGVWHEVLAKCLKIEAKHQTNAKNSLDGGTNYSYGGAVTAGGGDSYTKNIGYQVNTEFLGSKPAFSGTTLYTIWGGGNDLRNAAKDKKDLQQAAIDAVANLEVLVEVLAKESAKTKTNITVLWPNVPPMHKIPDFAGATKQ